MNTETLPLFSFTPTSVPSQKEITSTNTSPLVTVPFDENGYAIGWRMAVSKSMFPCIGLRLNEVIAKTVNLWDGSTPFAERVNRNWVLSVYSLSGEPSIEPGYIFYDTPEAYTGTWGDALAKIQAAVQVGKISDRGFLEITILKPNDEKNKLIPYATHEIRKDFLVFFLQTGLLITSDATAIEVMPTKNLHGIHYPYIFEREVSVPPPDSLQKNSADELKSLLELHGIKTEQNDKSALIDIALKNIGKDAYEAFKRSK